MKPLQYFFWLRSNHGYSVRYAWICTMMQFCKSSDELQARFIHINVKVQA